MATRRITVSVNTAQADEIRRLVEVGSVRSVSEVVRHAVSALLDDVQDWERMLAEALHATGGPVTDEERAWAD
jgi:Arc/MetJ-type ribon-helix-helix transcriptional regulator